MENISTLNPYDVGSRSYNIWNRNVNTNSIEDATDIELQIIEYYLDGNTMSLITKLVGRSITTVRNVIIKYKLKK